MVAVYRVGNKSRPLAMVRPSKVSYVTQGNVATRSWYDGFLVVTAFQFMTESHVEQIFRPHRHATYVDAAYCYRLSSMVCLSVCL